MPFSPLTNASGSRANKFWGCFYVFIGVMARKLRYIPRPRTLVSITNRTVQGRYLLRPGPSFNDLFLGMLGRAQRLHEMDVAAVSVLSNHFHMLLIVDDAQEVSGFLRDFQSKL